MTYAVLSLPKPASSWRSFARLASSRYSSASSQRSHCPAAWRIDSLRAAAKLSHQGKSKTRAPYCPAISLVLSVEPVSTTTISSTRSRTEARHRPSAAASFLTIIVSERRAVMVRGSVGDPFRAELIHIVSLLLPFWRPADVPCTRFRLWFSRPPTRPHGGLRFLVPGSKSGRSRFSQGRRKVYVCNALRQLNSKYENSTDFSAAYSGCADCFFYV